MSYSTVCRYQVLRHCGLNGFIVLWVRSYGGWFAVRAPSTLWVLRLLRRHRSALFVITRADESVCAVLFLLPYEMIETLSG